MKLIAKCPTCNETIMDGQIILFFDEEDDFIKKLLDIAPHLKQFEDGDWVIYVGLCGFCERIEPVNLRKYAKYFVHSTKHDGNPFGFTFDDYDIYYDELKQFAEKYNLNYKNLVANVNDILERS